MRGTIGSVIVFDLADRDTINEAMDWHYQLSDNNRINDKYIQVLVGHQKD
jgi:GTPase SAR1 family protein